MRRYRGYDFFSFFVIPALTLLLAAGYEPTATNLSVIGSGGGRRWLFLFWGAAAGSYYFSYVSDLMELGGCRDRLAGVLLHFSLFLFLCGIGLPYLPELVPVVSQLHEWCVLSGAVLLFLCLFRILRVLQALTRVSFRRMMGYQCATALAAAVIYLRVGIVSSLLEIFVTFQACIFLAALHGKLEKMGLSNH